MWEHLELVRKVLQRSHGAFLTQKPSISEDGILGH